MEIEKEISLICELLDISEEELADKLKVTYETINHWKNNRKLIDTTNLEKLYSFAFINGIRFNRIYEQFYKEDFNDDNEIILFHGSKKEFSLPINFKNNSKKNNDLGVGFYLGETFEQAANYISIFGSNKVYCFRLDLNELKIYKFEVSNEWIIAIAYFRGWIDEYKDYRLVKDILKKIEDSDVIIAPIADNRMFDIISEFIEGDITDEQCRHSLSATNLGFQYVLKTEKAVNNTSFIQEMFLSEQEKKECIKNRKLLDNDGIQKVKLARIEYKGKGIYFEELLK